MKEIQLNGLVKVATYPHRIDGYHERVMLYNELGEQFVFCVHTSQNCCEDFQYDIFYEENEIISTDGVKISIVYDDNFECECGGAIDIMISGTEKTYKWRVSNDHNGYYAHSVSLYHGPVCDELVWEEWL